MANYKRATIAELLANTTPAIAEIAKHMEDAARNQAGMVGFENLMESIDSMVSPKYGYEPDFDEYTWQTEDNPLAAKITEEIKPMLRTIMDMIMLQIMNEARYDEI